MVQASLEEFARTGNLGPVCLGKSRDEVRAALGPPKSWLASDPFERALIWKYGDVELYFDSGDNLYGIHFDDGWRSWSGGDTLALDPWIIRAGLTLDDLERGLRQSGVTFEYVPYVDPEFTKVATSCGVSFLVRTTPSTDDDSHSELGLVLFGVWNFSATADRSVPG